LDEENTPKEGEIMAKRKRAKTKKRVRSMLPGTSAKGLRTGRLPRLGDLKVPTRGLLDPSLRRDIGDIPGLAPTK